MALGETTRGFLDLGGAKIVGRRIDEIAHEKNGLDDAGKLRSIDAWRQFKNRVALFFLRPVAREAIAAERESECGELWIGGKRGEAPNTPGKKGRELARQKRIARAGRSRVAGEQSTRDSAFTRKQEKATCPRLEAARLHKGGRGLRQRRAHPRP